MDTASALRAAHSDPDDNVSFIRAMSARTRVEGPGIWLEPLADVESWQQLRDHQKEAVALHVLGMLGKNWRFVGLRWFFCQTGARYNGMRPGKTRAIAVFEHTLMKAQFSLIPGRSSSDKIPAGETFLTTGTIIPPFCIARWPVTRGQLNDLCQATSYHDPSWVPDQWCYGADIPVTNISRDETVGLCAVAGLRFPGRREWEHAARGGVTNTLPWHETVTGLYCWSRWSGRHDPLRFHPVCRRCSHQGTKSQGLCEICLRQLRMSTNNRPLEPKLHDDKGLWNCFGLVDVVGNVGEWVDGFHWNPRIALGVLDEENVHLSLSNPTFSVNRGEPHSEIGFRPVVSLVKDDKCL